MVAIYGTGGFGNTRLETEYAHGFAHEQSALLSMTAATPEQLEENPAELALACSAASHSKTERDLLSIVFRRCAKKSVKGKNTNRKTKPLNPPVVTLSSRDENRRRRYDPWASRRCDSPTGDRPGNCCRTSRHATRDWFCYQSDLSFSADHGHTNRHTTPGHFLTSPAGPGVSMVLVSRPGGRLPEYALALVHPNAPPVRRVSPCSTGKLALIFPRQATASPAGKAPRIKPVDLNCGTGRIRSDCLQSSFFRSLIPLIKLLKLRHGFRCLQHQKGTH